MLHPTRPLPGPTFALLLALAACNGKGGDSVGAADSAEPTGDGGADNGGAGDGGTVDGGATDGGDPTDSGDATDSGGDGGGEPTDDCTPTSDAAVTLCADRFWSQKLDGASQAELDAAIAAMPDKLRDQDLSDDVSRAQQLQWAVTAANNLSAATVTILIPAGTYDFTGLDDAHPSLSSTDFYQQPLRPKLFVYRDDLSLQGVDSDDPPVLTASGPGADGVHHGRVYVLIDSSKTRLTLQSLIFRGDADSSSFTDTAQMLHENAASLTYAGQWGAVMVGLNGGGNELTVEDCRFEQINGNGISAVGGLTVRRSSFEGVVPDPEEADPDVATVDLVNNIVADVGYSPGMDFHSGIRRAYAYGPTLIEDSTFSNLVQGVLHAADGYPLEISGNTFTAIYDHALYIFGQVPGGLIEGNTVDRSGNGAFKFAASTTDDNPETSAVGLTDGFIRDNSFAQVRNGSLFFSGTRNEISGNEVAAYDPASDPTGWYDRNYRPGYHYPDFFLMTESGQAGWSNHIVNNTFTDNTSDEGQLAVFLHQRTNVSDRSISGNTVSGASQTVYFHHLRPCSSNPSPCSSHTPSIDVEDGATLVVGAPEDCADCEPGSTYYLTELP